MRRVAVCVALVSCAGCPGPSWRPPEPDRSLRMAESAGGDEMPCAPLAGPEPLSPEAIDARRRALEAIDRGELVAARQALEKILERHPGSVSTLALLQGTDAAVEQVQNDAARALDAVPLTRVAPPPWRQQLAQGADAPAPLRISLQSRKPNAVVDVEAWFAAQGVSRRLLGPGGRPLPPFFPTVFRGAPLRLAIDHGDHHVLVHGVGLVTVIDAQGTVVRALDLTSFASGRGPTQPVTWAQAAGGMLFVSNANVHYARESEGANAFVSAVDLASGTLTWRSEPLVANSQNFVLYGGHLLSGYGFTAEPDFVYALDLRSGATAARIPLTTAPSYLAVSGSTLLVRGHDADFELSLGPSTPAPPGAPAGNGATTGLVLAASGVRLPSATARDLCLRARAIGLLDRGESAQAVQELFALSNAYRQHPVMGALAERVRESAAGTVTPKRDAIVLTRPPFEQVTVRRARVAGNEPPPRLVQRAAERSSRPDDRSWLKQHGLRHAEVLRIAPVDDGKVRPPAGIAPTYGNEPLRRILDHGDHLALIYGGRYLLLVGGGETIAAFDFDAYRQPPRVRDATMAAFAVQDLDWAELREGVVYVSHGGGSYASEVFGKKGFLSAIDAQTGELLWRSAPLSSNTSFVLVGAYLVSGYGFTGEPDFLHVIDRRSGKSVSRHPLASGPTLLVKKQQQLFVRTYDTDYVFDLLTESR